jgi:hypothetical protein
MYRAIYISHYVTPEVWELQISSWVANMVVWNIYSRREQSTLKGNAEIILFSPLWVSGSINKIYSSTILPMNFGISFTQRQVRGRTLAPICNIMSETNTAPVNKTSEFSTRWTDIFALNLCKYKFGIPRRSFTFVLSCYVSYLTDFFTESPDIFSYVKLKTGHILQTRSDLLLQTLKLSQPYLNRLPIMLPNITSMCLLKFH